MIHRALVAVAAAALVLAGRPLEEAADAAAPSPGASRARAAGPAWRPGAVLVRLNEDVPPAKVRAALPAGARLGAGLGAGVYDVGVPVGREALWAARLAAVPGVAWAQVDHEAWAVGAMPERDRDRRSVGRQLWDRPGTAGDGSDAAVVPDDPRFPEQWALEAIGMPAAWEVITDTTPVPIAVLDTGANLAHEDLAGQWWANPGEVPGNGVDDDGNGHPDDVHGWHFYQRYDLGRAYPRDDADLSDGSGHGTHVAGIIGAAGDNGLGVSGVAWRARLMVVRVLDDDAVGWESDIVRGIDYAVGGGARVVNLSIGLEAAGPALAEAVERAEAAGVLVVAAAGNDGGAVAYPAALPTVLAVGASGRDGLRATFSARGPELDLLAPGIDVVSTWNGRPYFARSGTSAAAPHAAGVVALLLARRPDLTPGEVRACLKLTAADVDPHGWDEASGAGVLDAARAVRGCGLAVHLPWVGGTDAAP